jgi:hypothetical protein
LFLFFNLKPSFTYTHLELHNKMMSLHQLSLMFFIATTTLMFNFQPSQAQQQEQPVEIVAYDALNPIERGLEILSAADESSPIEYRRVKRGSCSWGRSACMASCFVQNCSTGYCHRGANGICSCSRCGRGGFGNFGRK